MTTPTKQQIIEEATRLYFEDCFKNGCESPITPEIEELRESGFLSLAQSELMRDNVRREAEQWTEYNTQTENLEKKPFSFDVEVALTQGTTICGGRGCGKTTLAKTIVQELQRQGVNVKIFDNSQAWLNSSVETVFAVTPHATVESSLDSAVYDLSRLTPQEQRRFIEAQVKTDYYEAVNTAAELRNWRIYVFEEAEIILGKTVSPIMQQLISVGRNFSLSYLAIAQRLARINVDLISLSGQLYVSRLHEQNDLNKIKNWVPNTEQLKSLELGDFIKYSDGKTELVHVDKFETDTQHDYFITAAPREAPQPQPQITDCTPLIKLCVVAILGVILLIGVM